jgi:glycerol-3-phosphate dehydrogenase
MKISVIGAGAFGTSLANLFAGFSEEILILTSSDEKKNDINFHSMNSAVFQGKILRKNLKAVSSL